MQARHVIQYVPYPVHGPGLALPAGIAALLYLERGQDVCGWYAQARRSRYSAAFFMVENFYAERVGLVARSMEDDVHGPWQREFPLPLQQIRSPLPEVLGHELERLQCAFMDEWLFFPEDPQDIAEVSRYHSADLPLYAFNVRCRRLSRLSASGYGFNNASSGNHREWTHSSTGADPNLFEFLQKCWRLNDMALYRGSENYSAQRGSAL